MSPLVSISLESESTSEIWKSKSKFAMSTMARGVVELKAPKVVRRAAALRAAELAQTTDQDPAACRRGL